MVPVKGRPCGAGDGPSYMVSLEGALDRAKTRTSASEEVKVWRMRTAVMAGGRYLRTNSSIAHNRTCAQYLALSSLLPCHFPRGSVYLGDFRCKDGHGTGVRSWVGSVGDKYEVCPFEIPGRQEWLRSVRFQGAVGVVACCPRSGREEAARAPGSRGRVPRLAVTGPLDARGRRNMAGRAVCFQRHGPICV
jgi:hypothetical protein